jgi:hypothetical protein
MFAYLPGNIAETKDAESYQRNIYLIIYMFAIRLQNFF